MTSHLSEALRAAAAGLHPDEAGTSLIISHGIYLDQRNVGLVVSAVRHAAGQRP